MKRRGGGTGKKSANVFTPNLTPWMSLMSDRELFFEPGEYEFACYLGGLWGYLGIWESGKWRKCQVQAVFWCSLALLGNDTI